MLMWTSVLVMVCGTRAQYLVANCTDKYAPVRIDNESFSTEKYKNWTHTHMRETQRHTAQMLIS
jgi:hypothetical protein